MAQRIHNLSKWIFLREGSILRFSSDKRRLVCLDVNCPGEVCFYAVQSIHSIQSNPEKVTDAEAGRVNRAVVAPETLNEDGTVLSFIGLCKGGRDSFEFNVDGAFDLIVEGGSAYISTADGQEIATQIVAPVIFTRIANRKERNREIEMMMYKQKMNERRLYAALEEEFERRMTAVEKGQARYVKERNQGPTFASSIRPERRPPHELGERVSAAVESREDSAEAGKREKGAAKRAAKASTDVSGED